MGIILKNISRVNEFTDPEGLRDDEVVKLKNMILDGGIAKKRGAIQSYNTSSTGGTLKGLYELGGYVYGLVDGGSSRALKKLDSTWSAVKSGLSDVNLQFQRYNDRGIFSNGIDPLFTVEDGTSYNFIITKPDVDGITMTLSSGGNLDASSWYGYRMTYVTANGEESAFSDTFGKSTTTSLTMNLTNLPVSSDTRIKGRRIYRTEGNGSLYYLVATLDNTVTSYIDSLADTGLDVSEVLPYLVEVEKASSMCVHKNRLIFGNVTASNSVDILPFRLNVTAVSSGNLTGDYTYGMSFTMSNGRETDIVTTFEIELEFANASITYSPSRNQDTSAVSQVNIYRKKDDNSYYLVSSSSVKSRTFTDSTATLTSVFPAVSSDSYEEWINKSRIYYSDIDKPQQVPQLNYINVYSDDDEEITGIVDQEEGILIFKEKSICFVHTNGSPLNWRVVRLAENIGCSDGSTIQRAKNEVYFKYNDDIYKLSELGKPISLEFKNTLDGITVQDTAYISKYNWYVIVTNTELMIYDERNGSWLNFNPYSSILYSALETISGSFLIGGAILLRYEEDEDLDYSTSTYDNDSEITCEINSKHYTLDPTQQIKLRHLYSEFNQGGAPVTQEIVNPQTSLNKYKVFSTSGWVNSKEILDSWTGSLGLTNKFRYDITGDIEQFNSVRIEGILKNRDRVWS